MADVATVIRMVEETIGEQMADELTNDPERLKAEIHVHREILQAINEHTINHSTLDEDDLRTLLVGMLADKQYCLEMLFKGPSL